MTSRRAMRAVGLAGVLAGVGAALLMLVNAAPAVPAVSSEGSAATTSPIVVKLHARWCPICLATKVVWGGVETAYAGRVRFVVFDFTDQATTDASRLLARRLGLESVFDAYEGETGTVIVLDGVSKEIRTTLHGVRSQAEYRAAIDAALSAVPAAHAQRSRVADPVRAIDTLRAAP